MEKSLSFFKARALGLTRVLKLITRAELGFADPIDFTFKLAYIRIIVLQ